MSVRQIVRDSLRAWEISGGKEAIDKSENTKREIQRKNSLRMKKHVLAREIEMNLRKLRAQKMRVGKNAHA